MIGEKKREREVGGEAGARIPSLLLWLLPPLPHLPFVFGGRRVEVTTGLGEEVHNGNHHSYKQKQAVHKTDWALGEETQNGKHDSKEQNKLPTTNVQRHALTKHGAPAPRAPTFLSIFPTTTTTTPACLGGSGGGREQRDVAQKRQVLGAVGAVEASGERPWVGLGGALLAATAAAAAAVALRASGGLVHVERGPNGGGDGGGLVALRAAGACTDKS